jgi:hypothetical protein
LGDEGSEAEERGVCEVATERGGGAPRKPSKKRRRGQTRGGGTKPESGGGARKKLVPSPPKKRKRVPAGGARTGWRMSGGPMQRVPGVPDPSLPIPNGVPNPKTHFTRKPPRPSQEVREGTEEDETESDDDVAWMEQEHREDESDDEKCQELCTEDERLDLGVFRAWLSCLGN